MKADIFKRSNGLFPVVLLALCLFQVVNARAADQESSSLLPLLPEIMTWEFSEPPQSYLPENLFEHIDGAAEIYLSYDFQELLVARYKEKKSKAALTVEIYDMQNGTNSFGIYSAERYPESRFLPVGNQGYVEEGTLNLFVGSYYVKLFCTDVGPKTEEWLKLFSQEIVNRIKEKGGFPPLLQLFPREGLVANSEKFILRNFMGFAFLSHGYKADYRWNDLEFECFLMEAESEEDAAGRLQEFLDHFAKNGVQIQKTDAGYSFQDRYLRNVFMAKSGHLLVGVAKITEGYTDVGEKYLETMLKFLKEHARQ
ncbi:MAG: DUF6599 family protein [Candidatus Aminicenantales bacterium]